MTPCPHSISVGSPRSLQPSQGRSLQHGECRWVDGAGSWDLGNAPERAENGLDASFPT